MPQDPFDKYKQDRQQAILSQIQAQAASAAAKLQTWELRLEQAKKDQRFVLNTINEVNIEELLQRLHRKGFVKHPNFPGSHISFDAEITTFSFSNHDVNESHLLSPNPTETIVTSNQQLREIYNSQKRNIFLSKPYTPKFIKVARWVFVVWFIGGYEYDSEGYPTWNFHECASTAITVNSQTQSVLVSNHASSDKRTLNNLSNLPNEQAVITPLTTTNLTNILTQMIDLQMARR